MSEQETVKQDDSIPDSAQICRCGHSKDRHRDTIRDKTICVERFCPCSNFVLKNVK